MEILLKNGFIITENGIEKKDILISNEKIKEISKNIANCNNTLDCTGKYIIPGGVDVHTHFNIDVGIKSIDDFYSGGIAALFGGTTTIIDHPGFGPDKCPLDYQINRYLIDSKNCPVDFSFHGVLQWIPENIEEQLFNLKNKGITSFKLYTTYTYSLNDQEILKIFSIAKNLNLTIAIHAENHGMIEYLKEQFKKENKTTPIYHALSRPNISEAETVSRLIQLAKLIQYDKLYFVHISSKESLEILEKERNNGTKFFVETCPQYLFLDETKYLENDGELFILSPPLRSSKSCEAVLSSIKNKVIDVLATDHCSFSKENKKIGKINFLNCPNGIPGVQERIPLMFSLFLKGTISAKEFLETCCTNPSKIFGLYPKKGTISVGSDADIVIINPIPSKLEIKSNSNYSCFSNIENLVTIEKVFLRGNELLNNNEIKFDLTIGKFIKRE